MKKLFNFWISLNFFIRFCIIAALAIIMLLFTTYHTISALFSDWFAKEEDFYALTEIAYDISTSKNVTYPLSDDLISYSVHFNANNTIEIVLRQDVEILHVTLYDSYHIKSIQKDSYTTIAFILLLVLLILFGIGVSALIHFIAFIIKKCYKIINK